MNKRLFNEKVAKVMYGWTWKEEPIKSFYHKSGIKLTWTGPKKYEYNLPDYYNILKQAKEIIDICDEKGVDILSELEKANG